MTVFHLLSYNCDYSPTGIDGGEWSLYRCRSLCPNFVFHTFFSVMAWWIYLKLAVQIYNEKLQINFEFIRLINRWWINEIKTFRYFFFFFLVCWFFTHFIKVFYLRTIFKDNNFITVDVLVFCSYPSNQEYQILYDHD